MEEPSSRAAGGTSEYEMDVVEEKSTENGFSVEEMAFGTCNKDGDAPDRSNVAADAEALLAIIVDTSSSELDTGTCDDACLS